MSGPNSWESDGSFEYNLDYFSGAQANIYLGPVLLDEVTSLQWSVHQAKIPIYGYASQFFDEMARGTILVQGQFSINFIQPNYLFAVLNALKNRTSNTFNKREETLNEKLKDALDAYGGSDKDAPADLWKAAKELDKKNKDIVDSDFFKRINDTLWGPGPDEKKLSTSGRPDDTDFNGFDITINFKWETDDVPQASQTIKNVHILGSSRALMIDEQPIQEVYSFYAQKVENDRVGNT